MVKKQIDKIVNLESKAIILYTAIALMIMVVSSIIFVWTVSTKADESHTYVEVNRALPDQVNRLEEQVKELNVVFRKIDVLETNLNHAIKRVDKLANRLEKSIELMH